MEKYPKFARPALIYTLGQIIVMMARAMPEKWADFADETADYAHDLLDSRS